MIFLSYEALFSVSFLLFVQSTRTTILDLTFSNGLTTLTAAVLAVSPALAETMTSD